MLILNIKIKISGKKFRVAVFAKGEKADEALAAGADLAGSDELVEQVKAGKIEFDVCIATPNMMPVIGKLGKILGPKGLMPNPKLGTVTDNVVEATKAAKHGQVELKTDKNGVAHLAIGKLSFAAEDLTANFLALHNAVQSARPSGVKGNFILKIFVGSTMSPSLRLNLNSIN